MLWTKKAVIILCGLRFPENAGVVARACGNMGCNDLRLVLPERYDMFKAFPLATSIGRPVLENIRIYKNISEAVGDLCLLMGTSARTGDRRKRVLNSTCVAEYVHTRFPSDETNSETKFGILFGPEDRGLSNEELSLCECLINIPTDSHASSLNIAQAVLIVLYELFRATPEVKPKKLSDPLFPSIRLHDLELLEQQFKSLLIQLDALPVKNSTYFFCQWHDMLSRLHLKRHEYDALMGLCRQLRNKCAK